MVTQNGHFVFPDTPSLHQRWPSDRPLLPHPPPPEGSTVRLLTASTPNRSPQPPGQPPGPNDCEQRPAHGNVRFFFQNKTKTK
jgi:hypothetical protein